MIKMRGREPCAHATPSCRSRTRRSVACYLHVLLLAVACIADSPPSMAPMPSGGNETSGNEPTTQAWDTPPPGSEPTCRQTLTHIAVQPGGGSQWCACADDRSACNCAGIVRYGHAESNRWSQSRWINGTITCRSGIFGDPARETSPFFLCSLSCLALRPAVRRLLCSHVCTLRPIHASLCSEHEQGMLVLLQPSAR